MGSLVIEQKKLVLPQGILPKALIPSTTTTKITIEEGLNDGFIALIVIGLLVIIIIAIIYKRYSQLPEFSFFYKKISIYIK